MKQQSKSHAKIIIISLLSVIAILAGTVITTGFVLKNSSTDNQTNQQGVVFDSNASAYEETVANDSNDTTGIKVPGYADITALSGTTEFPITLLNPEGNPCNFKFTLSLAETGEKLYTTGLVKPGDAIKGVTLDSPLEKGEYTLVIDIQTSSVDTGAEMNGAQVKTKLTIE